jgi:hypothetical protein
VFLTGFPVIHKKLKPKNPIRFIHAQEQRNQARFKNLKRGDVVTFSNHPLRQRFVVVWESVGESVLVTLPHRDLSDFQVLPLLRAYWQRNGKSGAGYYTAPIGGDQCEWSFFMDEVLPRFALGYLPDPSHITVAGDVYKMHMVSPDCSNARH